MTLSEKIRENPRPYFLNLLAVFFLIFGIVGVLDFFDLRLAYSKMSPVQKNWTVFLTIGNFATAGFLQKRQSLGIVLFHLMAISQILVYWNFQDIFGRQDFLIIFHTINLALYWKIVAREKRSSL